MHCDSEVRHLQALAVNQAAEATRCPGHDRKATQHQEGGARIHVADPCRRGQGSNVSRWER